MSEQTKPKHQKRKRQEGTPLRFMISQKELDLLYFARRQATRRERRGYGMMKSANNNNRRPIYGRPNQSSTASKNKDRTDLL
jgi:hypothetical protein